MSGVHQEKEILNVMDDVGNLWQISIEGSRVRVVNGTPLEVYVQWNPSNPDTIGPEKSVLIREVSLFQGLKSTQIW